MPEQQHIVLLCSYLNYTGGYERIVVNTANLFAEKGIKTTLVILADTNESFFPINKDVQIVQQPLYFGMTKKGNKIFRKITMLAELMKLQKLLKKLKPSIIIGTEYHFSIAAVLSGARKFSKIISWEHTHFYNSIKNVFWQRLFKLKYPKLDAVVCLNKDEKELFYPLNKNVAVIPNFVLPANQIADLTKNTILTIAMLKPVKGIPFLLAAAKKVLHKHTDWRWKIIGDGELKNQVVEFIQKEKLQTHLILQQPSSPDLSVEYQQASLYVMTSLNECFPMVLLEALSTGVPCISFDCETGPRNIITNNKDGVLIEKENSEKLANAISNYILEENKRQMGIAAINNITRFSPDAVYKKWQQLFTSL